VSDRNLRVLEVSIAIQVTRANLGDLARSAGNGTLVALAAGLRVVEGSEAVRDLLYGVEFREVRLMRRLVRDAITAVVKSRGRLDCRQRRGRGRRADCSGDDERQHQPGDRCVHSILPSRHAPGHEGEAARTITPKRLKAGEPCQKDRYYTPKHRVSDPARPAT